MQRLERRARFLENIKKSNFLHTIPQVVLDVLPISSVATGQVVVSTERSSATNRSTAGTGLMRRRNVRTGVFCLYVVVLGVYYRYMYVLCLCTLCRHCWSLFFSLLGLFCLISFFTDGSPAGPRVSSATTDSASPRNEDATNTTIVLR